tara:strand:- start:1784 stop:2209 length:426 start_codon:yes stop_codon:yes gene_type:complete
MKYESIEIGYEISIKQVVTDEMVRDFAEVTGDFNKIHLDESYAKNTVFKSRIAHGFLYGSFISTVLGTKFPGKGTIYRYQDMKFLLPVYINDHLEIKVSVTEKLKKNGLKLKTEIRNQHDDLVLDGVAIVSVPKDWEIMKK